MATRRRREATDVGRHGRLRLAYTRQGRTTVIARSHCTSPWHFLPPIYLDDTGAAYTLLLNPSGGLVGGDHLSIDMTLGKGAHVLISSPSANRVYRSSSETSVQQIDLSIGPGAILEWVPEPTIPFAGSRFRQVLHVALGPGAIVMLWDAIASGRIARAERWAFSRLENEISITAASGKVLERYDLDPIGKQDAIGLAEKWDYVASFYVIGDTIEEERWKRLEESVGGVLDGCRDRVLAGVSEPSVRGRVVRLLTHSAPDLNAVLQSLWAAARAQLLDLPIPALRKY